MHPLTPRTERWREGGQHVVVDGVRVFVRHAKKQGTGETREVSLVFLHGYPTSSFDWAPVLEALSRVHADRPTLCFDFPGYGLSEKPRDRSYSIFAQTDVAEALVDRFATGPVLVVAHDMGTSVATEFLARTLEGRLRMRIAGMLLLNGSMVIDRSRPTLGQRLLRTPIGPLVASLSNERIFRAQLRGVFADPRAFSRRDADDAWSLVVQGDGHRMLHKPLVYMRERTIHAARWHGALRDWNGHLELAWGMRDPVARPAVLDALLALRPSAPVTRWEALGHYPQLEAPQRVAAAIASLDAACTSSTGAGPTVRAAEAPR